MNRIRDNPIFRLVFRSGLMKIGHFENAGILWVYLFSAGIKLYRPVNFSVR